MTNLAENTIINDELIRKIKIILHSYIYSDYNIALLIEELYSIDPFNIVYDSSNRTINIKMKKTSIKKYPNYKNDLNFFYGFFKYYIHNNLLLLKSNIIKCLKMENIHITDEQIEYIFNNYIYFFFTLTLLNDNFIIIHL